MITKGDLDPAERRSAREMEPDGMAVGGREHNAITESASNGAANSVRVSPVAWSHARIVLRWLLGGVLVAGIVYAVTHLSDVKQVLTLLRQVRLSWLSVALALQLGTYICAARVLQRALGQHGVRQRLRGLMYLGLAKLFTDQVVPSVGLGGSLLIARGLERRGVPAGAALGALVTSLAAYYIAYALVAPVSLLMLWRRGALGGPVLALVTAFCFVIAILPVGLFWMRARGLRHLPEWATRLPSVRDAVHALLSLSPHLLRAPQLIGETVSLQVAIFGLDAATLGVMLAALGQSVQPDVVFATFVVSSVVATLTFIPAGLGTFDATCVALLHAHGATLEAALAATLLFRVLTLWIPLAPGLWMARREVAGARGVHAGGDQTP